MTPTLPLFAGAGPASTVTPASATTSALAAVTGGTGGIATPAPRPWERTAAGAPSTSYGTGYGGAYGSGSMYSRCGGAVELGQLQAARAGPTNGMLSASMSSICLPADCDGMQTDPCRPYGTGYGGTYGSSYGGYGSSYGGYGGSYGGSMYGRPMYGSGGMYGSGAREGVDTRSLQATS